MDDFLKIVEVGADIVRCFSAMGHIIMRGVFRLSTYDKSNDEKGNKNIIPFGDGYITLPGTAARLTQHLIETCGANRNYLAQPHTRVLIPADDSLSEFYIRDAPPFFKSSDKKVRDKTRLLYDSYQLKMDYTDTWTSPERTGTFGSFWFEPFIFVYTRNDNNNQLADFSNNASIKCKADPNELIIMSWDAEWSQIIDLKGEKPNAYWPLCTLILGVGPCRCIQLCRKGRLLIISFVYKQPTYIGGRLHGQNVHYNKSGKISGARRGVLVYTYGTLPISKLLCLFF